MMSLTRREFIQRSTNATLALMLGFPLEVVGESGERSDEKKARVVLARHEELVDGSGKVNAAIFQQLLDEAISRLFDNTDALEAWKSILRPEDTLGIKSNVWGPLPTPTEVERSIRQRAVDCGIPGERIGIDDRGVKRNSVFQKCTALINVRPLRTHHWSGIGGCIKNYIPFVRHAPDYHPNSCENLGAIWNLSEIRGKTRLNILLLLTPLFHGIGPHHFSKKYAWPYSGFLVGTDPVALDAVGLNVLMQKRFAHFGERRPLKPPAIHVVTADQKHGIGVSDLRSIEVIRMGWEKGILI